MIKLVVIDFDGVFTNGQVMFDNNGSPIKSYNVKDYVGIKLLYNEDIKFGVISGYKDNLSQQKILEHLGIKKYKLNCKNKLEEIKQWCIEFNIDLESEVAYMGDDLNDLDVIKTVRLSGCPNDAVKIIKSSSKFVSEKNGGFGCVRDFCEFIIHHNNKKTISGLICVKYESSRLPFKNFRKFGNSTLLDLKINKLLSLNFLDEVIVNTESEFIIDYIKKKYDNKKLKIIKRDKLYATDNVENYDFCKNVVSSIENEYVLYSPVTMPFITNETYENIYDKIYDNNYDSIILVADGKQGKGHLIEKHKFCFGCSLMKKSNILKFGDFIGENPYFIQCNTKERIDIDYPEEYNNALYHYYNNDSIYGNENKNSLELNSLYNLDLTSPINKFIEKHVEEQVEEHVEEQVEEQIEKQIEKQVKIIDVTIRDGGFNNEWRWDIEEVKEKLECASKTGIEYFEIGYICDDPQDNGHFRNVSFDTINKIYDMVKPKCKICVLCDAWRYNVDKLLHKTETKIDLVRVVTYMENEKLLYAIEQCKLIKKKGYEVSLNVMCSSYFTKEILENLKTKIIDNIDYLDYVYFADSYGNMEPKYVSFIFENIISIRKIKPNIKIGFHIHNNGQIGMANMIKSLDYVDIIDASYFGMGRGMGNVRLEDVVLFLILKKNYNLCIKSFLNYLEKICNTYQKEEIKHTLVGFLNIHPYRLKDIEDNTFTLYETYNYLLNLPFDKKYDYLI